MPPALNDSTDAVSTPPGPTPPVSRRGWVVWVSVLVTVFVAHVLIALWVASHRTTLDETPIPEIPITLIPLKPVAPPAPPAPPVPKPAVKQSPRKPVAPSRPDTLAAPATADTPGPQAASETVAGDGNTPGAPASQAQAAPPAGPPLTAAAANGDKFDPPPSVTLTYDALMNGVRNQTGEMQWVNENGHYRLRVAVPIIFLGTFEFISEGGFDVNGIAPSRYVEKRGRRAEYITDFHRDAPPTLTFTRSGQSLPLAPGAQDRFSVMMQLASYARGNPERYTQVGVTHEFTVVDTDSSEVWPVQYVGVETLRTPHGYVETRHFTRLPRKAGDERRVDIWLAPSLDWLPVRVKQTEPSGNEFELIFSQKSAP
ncbi:DUF3108 domain-containing protein [Pandoraea apista]|uniref:DUF3108 domain-containing protein n=1 Tax=Pandoraea apista TaxID=93218 RepID=A0A5E5P1R1_9BURK|nr:DUF3108 domain-containing protein [Pandoraea apista]CFB62247.1 hypothetical protein LMG16407_02319 [Pandoraea apista]VVG69729.1 hypothetical protein PAP18089_00686 [Pandoraea apista]